MQVERLLKIIFYLFDKEIATAQELADYLGVSKRTVFRDLDTLSLSGVPVYAERGNKGGFKLMDSFIMNKSIISEQEQNEILSALHSLSTIRTNETIQALKKFSSFFNKEPQGWFEVDIAGWGDENNYTGMKTAIIEKQIIEFEYYNTKGEKSHRRVEPIKLWFKSGSWYLNAFCLNKQDVRLFKLSRTRNLTITDAMFTERELPTQNPDGEPADAFPNKIMLVMKIAPEMAYRVYDNCDEDEIVKNEDGSITIFQWWDYENNAMYGYILSFGEYAEVLEPKHIRAILRDKGLSIAKKYFLQ